MPETEAELRSGRIPEVSQTIYAVRDGKCELPSEHQPSTASHPCELSYRDES